MMAEPVSAVWGPGAVGPCNSDMTFFIVFVLDLLTSSSVQGICANR